MAVQKSELYISLGKSWDKLRGGMDASQYKDYALVQLFGKYLSDKAATHKNSLLTVLKGGSFAVMDAELAALEACRDRTRALKQGMMRELLAGRFRLPVEKAV